MTELDNFRTQKDAFFATPQSPLEPGTSFQGLSYFPESEALRFMASIEPSPGGELTVGTSDGQSRSYQRAGIVRFEVNGTDAQLTLLHHTGDDGYFVPFRDATSGKESYGAGRYLDLDLEENGVVSLDFNLAHNPYCAYSEAYSCPLPPAENWLTAPIEAGEKKYEPTN